jgi:hypothetical protein
MISNTPLKCGASSGGLKIQLIPVFPGLKELKSKCGIDKTLLVKSRQLKNSCALVYDLKAKDDPNVAWFKSQLKVKAKSKMTR